MEENVVGKKASSSGGTVPYPKYTQQQSIEKILQRDFTVPERLQKNYENKLLRTVRGYSTIKRLLLREITLHMKRKPPFCRVRTEDGEIKRSVMRTGLMLMLITFGWSLFLKSISRS